jgi:hypothetical protein
MPLLNANATHDPNKPWTMSRTVWCQQTGNDSQTYERLVQVAYEYGEFHPDDKGVSNDARWTAQRTRHFGNRRVH